MARSKKNKQMDQAGKAAAEKLKAAVGSPEDLDELLGQMDEQDAEDEPPDNEEDRSEDEFDWGDEDEIDFLEEAKKIMKANIDESTKHGYRLSLVRLVDFLYCCLQKQRRSKKKKKKKKAKESEEKKFDKLLHPLLVKALDEAVEKDLGDKEWRELIYSHVGKASAEYHPIDLNQLDVHIFITHLCGLTKPKPKGGRGGKRAKTKDSDEKVAGDKKEEQEF